MYYTSIDQGAIADLFAVKFGMKAVNIPDELGVAKQTWQRFVSDDSRLTRRSLLSILSTMMIKCETEEGLTHESHVDILLVKSIRHAMDAAMMTPRIGMQGHYDYISGRKDLQTLLVESEGNCLAHSSRSLLDLVSAQHVNTSLSASHVYDLNGDFAAQCDRHFTTIINTEVADIAHGLTGASRKGFFCTDTSLSSLHPEIWSSENSLSKLLESSEMLARQYSLDQKRDFTRIYILGQEDCLFSNQVSLWSFMELARRQLRCGIMVGVIREDQLAQQHSYHFRDCYVIPETIALFGSQPIPVTARFCSSDTIGKAMVGLGDYFREHILSTVRRRDGGFLLSEEKEIDDIPELLGTIGLLSDE